MSYGAVSPSGKVILCRTREEIERVKAWSKWCASQRTAPLKHAVPFDPQGMCRYPTTYHSAAFCRVELVNGVCFIHGDRAQRKAG
jgi:hypothetical protein